MAKINRSTLNIGLLLLVLLSACALRTRVPVSVRERTPVETEMNVDLPTQEPPAAQATPPLPTAALQTSPTTQPTATVQVIADQPAAITAEGVNLREGPGTLFDRVGQLSEGTMVTVTGKAPGDDWIYIAAGDSQGWVSVAFTSMAEPGKLATVPVLETGDAQVIQGRVYKDDGMPLAGIEFAAYQGSEDSNPPDTRAHSLADGGFFLYLPPEAQGSWRVSLTAVDCKSSIVDDNCNFVGAFMPRVTDVTLPADEVVEFQYTR